MLLRFCASAFNRRERGDRRDIRKNCSGTLFSAFRSAISAFSAVKFDVGIKGLGERSKMLGTPGGGWGVFSFFQTTCDCPGVIDESVDKYSTIPNIRAIGAHPWSKIRIKASKGLEMTLRSLAIETSSRLGSVALAENGNTLAQDTFPHGLQHAARIIPAIDTLCRQLQWTATDLREIYISAGPGSFTGLRIGITLAKTLALATGAALVAVPSVRVLVENAPPEAKNAIIVLDAKRDQIFTASFTRTPDGWTELEPAQLSTLAAICLNPRVQFT